MPQPHEQFKSQQAPHETGAPDPSQATWKMIEAASFIGYRNDEIARQPKETPGTPRRVAFEKVREMRSTVEILTPLAQNGADPEAVIFDQLQQLPPKGQATEKELRQIGRLEVAFSFVRDQTVSPSNFENVPKFHEWRQRRQEQAAQVAEQGRVAERQVETRQRETQTQGAREKIGEIFVDEILDKGGVAILTDLPGAYSNTHSQGFSARMEQKRAGKAEDAFRSADLFDLDGKSGQYGLDAVYGGKGIYEAVVFRPVMKAEYEHVEVPGPKGRWGRRGPSTTRPQWVGESPVMASEVVPGSTEEPAVEMVYRTFSDPDGKNRKKTGYQCTDGRYGNVLFVSVVMPASLARELEKSGRQDPTIIRQVAEGAVLRNIGIPEDAWKTGNKETGGHAMRPPYEGWAASNGGVNKMYFKEAAAKQFDRASVVEARA